MVSKITEGNAGDWVQTLCEVYRDNYPGIVFEISRVIVAAEAKTATCVECQNWSGFTGRCSETGFERGAKDTCCKGDV